MRREPGPAQAGGIVVVVGTMRAPSRPGRGAAFNGSALVALVALVAPLLPTGGAQAKYPGANGRIAFARLDRAIDGHHVFTAGPRGAHETRLLPGDVRNPIWSPDGSKILVTPVRADAPLRPAMLSPDGSDLTLLDTPAPIEIGCSAWSPDGTRILCEGTSEENPDLNGLYTARASDGGDLVRLSDNPFDAADIAGDYSPDGARIVFTRQRPGSGRPKGAVYVASADGTGLRRITPFGVPDHDEQPKWSPEGTEILFGSATEKLLVIHPDGTGARRIVPRTLGKRRTRKLRERLLKRCRKRAGNASCRKKAAKRARRRATAIGFDPGWSPNGGRIVLSLRHRPRGRVDIYTAKPDGTDLVQVTDTREFETFSDWGPRPAAR